MSPVTSRYHSGWLSRAQSRLTVPWIIAFLERYATAEAQLADAALMYLAEREGIDTVFTLDRRDFSIYRTTDGRALTIIPEP